MQPPVSISTLKRTVQKQLLYCQLVFYLVFKVLHCILHTEWNDVSIFKFLLTSQEWKITRICLHTCTLQTLSLPSILQQLCHTCSFLFTVSITIPLSNRMKQQYIFCTWSVFSSILNSLLFRFSCLATKWIFLTTYV